MTSNIKMKLALILGSTLLLLLVTVGATFYTARLQEGDAVVINIAGRQRMLSQKTIKEAYTISLSESEKAAEYRKKLRKTVDLFEKSIHGLIDGDIELGLPPTTNPEILAQINKVHDIWAGIHESAEIIITVEDKTDNRYLSAIEFLGAKNEDLLHEVDKVVQMYEMAASQKVQRLIVVLIIFTLSSVAIFAIGWRAYGHYIAKPLQVVVASIDQVAGGDLSNPKIPIKSSDEIGQLGASINSMVEGLRERDRIKDLFCRFQTVEVMDSLLKMPESFQLSGGRRKITIMFTDLRGFTALSDSIEPEQVVRLLNQYFESMFGICQKYKGIINEILGDGLVAYFGAPLIDENHIENAIACAVQMQNAMKKINQKFFEKESHELKMGIGLNTGEVVVGNIGCQSRTKYAAVGSNVNLAARITSCADGGQIFCSDLIVQEIEPVLQIKQQMHVSLKGISEPVKIYNIVGINGQHNVHLSKINIEHSNDRCVIDWN